MSRRRFVHIHKHAREQYQLRGGKGNLQRIVECRLRQQLKLGAKAAQSVGDLIIEVPVSPTLKALCTPMRVGGWLCFTVLKRDWRIA